MQPIAQQIEAGGGPPSGVGRRSDHRVARSGVAARTLVFAYLGCVTVSKLADANEHPDLSYVPLVAVCFVLPFWYVSGWARGPWLRAPWLLLLAQGAVTYLGFALFQDHWVGGVSGLLGGLVLLTVRPPWSWWLFGALAVAELAAWLLVGLPYQPTANAVGWVLIAFGNVGLSLFGLTRLATLVERLESTKDALADAAVVAQRLATANDVRSTIMRRLEQLSEHVRTALADERAAQRTELHLAGEAARAAAASARHIVTAMPTAPEFGTANEIEQVTPALAQRVVTAVVALFGAQYLLNLAVPVAGGGTASLPTTALAVVIAVSMVLLQLRHSRFRAHGELPPAWPWTLGVQAVLCFVAYPIFGVVSTVFLAFLGGSILLLIERPTRWVLFGAIVLGMPVLTLLRPADLSGVAFQLQWSVYAASTLGGAGVMFYGLSRFNRTAGALDVARRQLAVVAVTRERLRIARDAHDTLGLGLSTIALKSDLAQSLLDRSDPRAHREIVHMLHLARTVASDAESIVHGTLALDLDAEFATARDVLTTAGVATTITCESVPLEATTGSELAAILREAVTNVLRHSTARECRVDLLCRDGQVRLVVDNDGAPPESTAHRGNGLANIATRIARMNGAMDVTTDGDRFVLAVRVPAEPGATT